jgi:hypothetical protein
MKPKTYARIHADSIRYTLDLRNNRGGVGWSDKYFQHQRNPQHPCESARIFLGLIFPASWRGRACREREAEIVERGSATVGLIRSVFASV